MLRGAANLSQRGFNCLHKKLVVEDFNDLRELVTFYLCNHGYDVLGAPTGKAGIETAVTENPDLVLLDLRLT